MADETAQHESGAFDSWHFRRNSKQSYLVQALEQGNKSKDTIRSEYSYRFSESRGASDSKNTFDMFFLDFPKLFGTGTASRSTRILVNEHGHCYLDTERAAVVKAAIAKGLLKEINAIQKGQIPKTDRIAIESVMEKYRVPRK